jgi:hypothetical protein
MTVLKSHNEVIGKTHGDHIAFCVVLSPSPQPKVKYIVKMNVNQQRTNTSTLDRTLFLAK